MVASYDLDPGTRFDWHAHALHQLSIAADGVLSLGVANRAWVLPRTRGLWIPAGIPHTVDPIGSATMTTLWFGPKRCPVPWLEPTIVEVDDLMSALVARLDDDVLSTAERKRSEAVLFDLLRRIPADTLDVPMPTDDRARRVADAIVANPNDPRTMADWGRMVGASDRTLMRVFVADTGLSFNEWRTRARLSAALPRLAAGVPVAVVATMVGYTTASAFGAAFRRTLGTTPSAYFGLAATTTRR